MQRFRGSGGTWLDKASQKQKCPKRKERVLVNLRVTVSVSVSLCPLKPWLLALTTDWMEAGGPGGKGRPCLSRGNSVKPGFACHQQPWVRGNSPEWNARLCLQIDCLSWPHMTTCPFASPFHLKNRKRPNCNSSLPYCTKRVTDGQTCMGPTSAAVLPCLGPNFLQFTQVCTTQIADNIKVYVPCTRLTEEFIDVSSSDYSITREGQEENLIFFNVDLCSILWLPPQSLWPSSI